MAVVAQDSEAVAQDGHQEEGVNHMEGDNHMEGVNLLGDHQVVTEVGLQEAEIALEVMGAVAAINLNLKVN